MNVYKCRGRAKDTNKCIYMSFERSLDGELVECGCSIKQKDHYNIFPEFDESSGDVIYQTPTIVDNNGNPLLSTDVDPVGPKLIWENITGQHQHGLSFDNRDFEADIHPLYHITQFHVPTKSNVLEPDTICDIFGDKCLTLVSPGWNDDKSYGLPQIETCTMGLYGRYDELSGTVIHRCMRNYSLDIIDWTDYTIFAPRNEREYNKLLARKKFFFLSNATNELVDTFCTSEFEDKVAAYRMAEIMKAVRDGDFINLYQAAINNGMPPDQASHFMSKISFKSKKSIYSGTVNIQKLHTLYSHLGNIGLQKEYVKMYRANIVNYVLNFPKLQNLTFKENYETQERYWFAILILRRAISKDKIVIAENLPSWIIHHAHRLNNIKISTKVLGTSYNNISEAPRQIQADWETAVDLGLRSSRNDSTVAVERLFPAMETISKILGKSFTKSSEKKLSIFTKILQAGVKWNKIELIAIWNKFSRIYGINKPRLFWEYIYELDDLDYDELNNRIKGEGNVGQKRIFLQNIIDGRSPYREEDNWEIDVPKLMTWSVARARHKAKFKTKSNHFWTKLKKVGGLKNDIIFDEKYISDSDVDKLIETTMIKDELHEDNAAPSQEPTMDTSEYDGFSEIDPETGLSTPMVVKGDTTWQDEE